MNQLSCLCSFFFKTTFFQNQFFNKPTFFPDPAPSPSPEPEIFWSLKKNINIPIMHFIFII
jgi:hypothetical protein